MIYEFGDAKRFHEAFENLLDEYGSKVFHDLPQISVLVHLEEFQNKYFVSHGMSEVDIEEYIEKKLPRILCLNHSFITVEFFAFPVKSLA